MPDDTCHDGQPHDWDRDPDHLGEGLRCLMWGVTEAELYGGDDDV